MVSVEGNPGLRLYGEEEQLLLTMTLDEKIRLGMVAVSGASLVLVTLGVHLGPLAVVGGSVGD